jgi:hypothetical protein
MRKIMLAITPIVASAALVVLSAGPASAADAGTGTTFTILGGTLAISAPSGTVSLGTATASADAQTIGGALGPVTVTDGRGAILGWTTTAISTAFTGGSGLPASAVSYVPGTVTKTGISLLASASPTDLTTAKTVQTATAVVGANSAAWSPTITVAVPVSAQTGLYTATMTHSVI